LQIQLLFAIPTISWPPGPGAYRHLKITTVNTKASVKVQLRIRWAYLGPRKIRLWVMPTDKSRQLP